MVQGIRIQLPTQETQFHPWSPKIPHAAEQLSPSATSMSLNVLEPVLRNKSSHCSKKAAAAAAAQHSLRQRSYFYKEEKITKLKILNIVTFLAFTEKTQNSSSSGNPGPASGCPPVSCPPPLPGGPPPTLTL